MSNSDNFCRSASVSRNKELAVLVRPKYKDANGVQVLRLASAINRIRGFSRLSKSSMPRFRKAMEDDSACNELQKALKNLCELLGCVGVVSVDDD